MNTIKREDVVTNVRRQNAGAAPLSWKNLRSRGRVTRDVEVPERTVRCGLPAFDRTQPQFKGIEPLEIARDDVEGIS